jgi:hypothetical protein
MKFVVTYQRWNGGEIRQHDTVMEAENIAAARRNFTVAYPRHPILNVVPIAPAVQLVWTVRKHEVGGEHDTVEQVFTTEGAAQQYANDQKEALKLALPFCTWLVNGPFELKT